MHGNDLDTDEQGQADEAGVIVRSPVAERLSFTPTWEEPTDRTLVNERQLGHRHS